MIDLFKIIRDIKKIIIWLIITNYGRFILGGLLALTGVFSQYGTILFLSTDLLVFEITATIGIILLTCQFGWVIIRSIYLYLNNKK